MAPTSDPPKGKPGAKQYLIVGGVTLAAALAYLWWRQRHPAAAAAPAAADTGGAAAPATPTGLSTADFWLWIKDHSSSTTKTTTAKAAGHGCRKGFHWEPVPAGHGTLVVGAYPHDGGACVPDKPKAAA